MLVVQEVEALRPEVEALAHVLPSDARQADCVRDFDQQMKALVEASLRLQKPISF